MAYYTRVLSKSAECPSFNDLHGQLRSQRPDVVLSLEDGEPSEWMSLVLSHADGLEIASIERNVVLEGQLGSEELAEFVDEVSRCKPETGARWLLSFLREVRVIYAFQHLSGTEKSRGDDALWMVTDAIRAGRETIMQADGEGFYNDQGQLILWQLSDHVSGPWRMAVRQDERWIGFRMDLGNHEHRRAFFEGRVPPGVKTA